MHEIISLTAGYGDRPAHFYLEDYGDAFWYALDRYAKENRLTAIQVYLAPQNHITGGRNTRFPHTRFLFIPRGKPWLLFSCIAKRLNQAKILQINTFPTPWTEFPIALLAKLFRVKLVEFVLEVYAFPQLGLRGKILGVYYRYLYLPMVDAIITLTEYQRRKCFSRVKAPTYVFPLGAIEPLVFKPCRKKPSAKLRIIFVGAIHPNKKIEDIVSAISVSGAKDDIALQIVGPIVDKKYFEYLKQELKRERIHHKFSGFIPRNKLPWFYSNADVFVNMRPDEALGKVFVEAMACGIPVIGRHGSPGPEELIQNGWNGYLVKNVEELGLVLRTLTKNRKLLEKMGKNCLKFVRNYYTYEHAYLKLKEIYDSVLQKLRTGG